MLLSTVLLTACGAGDESAEVGDQREREWTQDEGVERMEEHAETAMAAAPEGAHLEPRGRTSPSGGPCEAEDGLYRTTMRYVVEGVTEADRAAVFEDVQEHLRENGYVVGSEAPR